MESKRGESSRKLGLSIALVMEYEAYRCPPICVLLFVLPKKYGGLALVLATLSLMGVFDVASGCNGVYHHVGELKSLCGSLDVEGRDYVSGWLRLNANATACVLMRLPISSLIVFYQQVALDVVCADLSYRGKRRVC